MDPALRLHGRSRHRKKIPKLYKTTDSLLFVQKLQPELVCHEDFGLVKESVILFRDYYKDVWDDVILPRRSETSIQFLDKIDEQRDRDEKNYVLQRKSKNESCSV